MSLDARALLRKHGLWAKKSWGQNFLVEERVFGEIVRASGAGEGDWVVEIGAGLGTLTARLAAVAARVVAIERDRDMVAVLRAELGETPNVEIAEANALTFDHPAVAARAGRRVVVVGNLPYQIASPLLFRLLDARASIARSVVMLQREMAERIVAAPGTPEYGALGVMVRMMGEPRIVCRVAAGAFHPPPRVESAVLRIDPLPWPLVDSPSGPLVDSPSGPGTTSASDAAAGPASGPPVDFPSGPGPGGTRAPVSDLAWFGRVVHAAFGQRRKMLRNALRTVAVPEAIERALADAGLDGAARGETLDVAAFARLTDALAVAASPRRSPLSPPGRADPPR